MVDGVCATAADVRRHHVTRDRAATVDDGAVHVTVAEALPPIAATSSAPPGAVGRIGVTALDGADAGPVPIALVALTVNVYAVPLVSPVTVALVAGGVPVTVVALRDRPMYGVTV